MQRVLYRLISWPRKRECVKIDFYRTPKERSFFLFTVAARHVYRMDERFRLLRGEQTDRSVRVFSKCLPENILSVNNVFPWAVRALFLCDT